MADSETKKVATLEIFLSFESQSLELALMKLQGKSYNDVFSALDCLPETANRQRIGNHAVSIMLDYHYMKMLECWLACNKNPLLLKLTWTDDWTG